MKTTNRKIKFLTDKEVRQIIDGIGVAKKPRTMRDKAILETLFSTGLRVHELIALPDAPFIQAVGQTMELSIMGKGGRQRTIYFSPLCLKAIKNYLALREDSELLLFPLTIRAVQIIVKKRATDAGFGWVHPHTLRHSLATDMLRKGVNLFDVKEFLGHASINTTQVYLHATNPELKNIHTKLYK